MPYYMKISQSEYKRMNDEIEKLKEDNRKALINRENAEKLYAGKLEEMRQKDNAISQYLDIIKAKDKEIEALKMTDNIRKKNIGALLEEMKKDDAEKPKKPCLIWDESGARYIDENGIATTAIFGTIKAKDRYKAMVDTLTPQQEQITAGKLLVYVVLDDFTKAIEGIYTNQDQAWEKAQRTDGKIKPRYRVERHEVKI